jgi:hypothetical protein
VEEVAKEKDKEEKIEEKKSHPFVCLAICWFC